MREDRPYHLHDRQIRRCANDVSSRLRALLSQGEGRKRYLQNNALRQPRHVQTTDTEDRKWFPNLLRLILESCPRFDALSFRDFVAVASTQVLELFRPPAGPINHDPFNFVALSHAKRDWQLRL